MIDFQKKISQLNSKTLLRFFTCGSVDDGKSTLIGRLLYDCNMLSESQLTQLKEDSKKSKYASGKIDFSLLVDGLNAEREQGITIDVAYRYFNTDKRNFIVADTPGHEQYTRNMVTGASSCDLALILVDATKGILTQTKRHSFLVKLMGVQKIVLVINKMDLVNYDESVFQKLISEYSSFAKSAEIDEFYAIPLSGKVGDNVVNTSENMPWYTGETLISFIEKINISEPSDNEPFRMVIQSVIRLDGGLRGYLGQVASGSIKVGDFVFNASSKSKTKIRSIIFNRENKTQSSKGEPVIITFGDQIDCSRGDIITDERNQIDLSDQLDASIVWFEQNPMVPGRLYFLKIGALTVSARVSLPKYKINIENLEKVATKTLKLNEVGCCIVYLDRKIPFEPFVKNKTLGSFILIDKETNSTIGAGLINHPMRRSLNLFNQNLTISKENRSNLKNQKPLVLWFTGMSGAGKSTIANALEQQLFSRNLHTYLLDGDNVRLGLNKDLGFSEIDRVENIRRVAEVTKLMIDAGLIVLTAFISPFQSERKAVRDMFPEGEFIEIFIDAPMEILEKRDTKGLYKKAKNGEIQNFTGISSPYQVPDNPEITIDTSKCTVNEAVSEIIEYLGNRKYSVS